VDVVQRRLLPIRADGTIEDAITFPGVSLLPVASDRSGRIFGDVMIFNGRVLSDSMRVVRWDLSRNRLDTLLTYDAGRAGMISRGGEARQVYRTTTSWTVLPDGGWISLHAGSYALTEWREGMPPRVVRLPLAAAPITQGDKDAYIAAQSAEPGRQLGQAGAQPSGRPRPEAIWSFPARFPAFDADTPLLRAPDGMLWIRRLHGVRETQPVYDLILPAGRLVAQLATSPGSEVVGFGVGVVYLSHRDADGLHTITRHPLPDLPQQP
jgi:hypothetical protein